MLDFLVDNSFVVFWRKVLFAVAEGWLLLDIGWFVLFFKQIFGTTMGKYYVPLLADIFLYSYEAEFIQSLLSTGKKH